MKLYVIYDLLAEEGGPMIEQPNDKTAYRAFKSFLQESKAPLEDFELYCIGSYDHDQVMIAPCAKRRVVEGMSHGEG